MFSGQALHMQDMHANAIVVICVAMGNGFKTNDWAEDSQLQTGVQEQHSLCFLAI